jgi:hypothetical protein
LEIQHSPRDGGLATSLRIGEPLALAPGDAVIVPNGHDAELRNTGEAPAVVLIAVLAPNDAATLSSTPIPATTTASMLLPSSNFQLPSSTPTPRTSASPMPRATPADDPARGHPS